jgi:hypothetical protein
MSVLTLASLVAIAGAGSAAAQHGRMRFRPAVGGRAMRSAKANRATRLRVGEEWTKALFRLRGQSHIAKAGGLASARCAAVSCLLQQ